jgi:hypothetical protein
MTSILPTLKSSLQGIAETTFLEFIRLRITLEKGNNNDILYMSNLYCNGHGDYTSPESCDCDMGFFGKYCEFNGVSLWGNGWTFLQVLVAIIYTIIAIITWIYFIRTINLVNYLNTRNLVTSAKLYKDYTNVQSI